MPEAMCHFCFSSQVIGGVPSGAAVPSLTSVLDIGDTTGRCWFADKTEIMSANCIRDRNLS